RQRLFLLDVMDQCAVRPFPAAWTAALRRLLSGKDGAVRARVVALARSRQLAGLDADFARIAATPEESADIRTGAVGALVSRPPASSHPADGIAAERIPELLKSFPESLRPVAQPLLARIEKEKQLRAERLKSLEPLLKGGNIDRGRDVFFGKKAGCASCHTIMSDGGDVGAELKGVCAIRSGIDLLQAIVYPGAGCVPGHEV